MSDQELLKNLKESLPIDLIPEDQRDTMKKISKTLGYAPIVKLIKATTNLGLKEAKLYYELYLK